MKKNCAGQAFRCVSGLVFVALLAACGGGGGGGTTTSTATVSSWPTSGTYSPVVKLQGSSTAKPLSFALSFVHSANPTVEYVLDSSAAPNALGMVMHQGSYNAASQQVTGLTPVAYLDAPNGAVRVTSLSANGVRPVQLGGSTLAMCNAKVTASNYATPYASQVVAATPGADGVCGTADDAEALITFNAAGSPTATAMTPGTSLGYLRSSTTGLPTYLLRAFADGQASALPIPSAINGPASQVVLSFITTSGVLYKPVQNLNDAIFYTRNGALMALNGRTSLPSAVALSAVTGPDGWQSAGYDSNNAYAYLNSSTASSGGGNWRILSISRSTLGTTTLATGSGAIQAASISGGSTVFTSVLNGGLVSVFRIATSTGLVSPYLSSSSQVSEVATDASGSHILITTGSSGIVSTQVINDAGTVFYTTNGGILYGGDNMAKNTVAGTVVSSSYLFTAPFGSAGFGGATITRYDIATQTLRVLGTLPTGSSLGGAATDAVFAGPLIPDSSFGGVHVSRLISSLVQTAGAAVYTYDTSIANSLTITKSQVK